MPNITQPKKTDKSRFVILIAAALGAIDSGYLTLVKFTPTKLYCTPGLGDCTSVNNSQWSELWGIPVAVFGLLTYLVLAFLVFFGSQIRIVKPYQNLLIFGISLIGLLFSLYLTYIELFVLHTICQWCMVSAVMITIIFITSIIKLVKVQKTV